MYISLIKGVRISSNFFTMDMDEEYLNKMDKMVSFCEKEMINVSEEEKSMMGELKAMINFAKVQSNTISEYKSPSRMLTFHEEVRV